MLGIIIVIIIVIIITFPTKFSGILPAIYAIPAGP